MLEGGSSLTQQLARSLYPELVGEGDTLGRKWRELLVALQLESRFSKGELLLSYLNRVYPAWMGFEDAARTYFDRSAGDLNLEQAACWWDCCPLPTATSVRQPPTCPRSTQPGDQQDGRRGSTVTGSGKNRPSAADSTRSGPAAARPQVVLRPSTPIKCAGI